MNETRTHDRREISAEWIDYQVDRETGRAILAEEKIPAPLIEIALEPGVLPKFETVGEDSLWLLREFDAEADRRAGTPRELTRKFAIFIRGSDRKIITAHRYACENLVAPPTGNENLGAAKTIVPRLLDRTLRTYLEALDRSEDLFDELEAAAFGTEGAKPFRLRDGYFLKRRLMVIRKTLLLIQETIESAEESATFKDHPFHPIQKKIGYAMTEAKALDENVNHILQLHLALTAQKTNEASQRTNEVMRVLTIFSAFFLPLSFIAGVYGMNFQGMPELVHPYGYPAAIGFMAIVAGGIFVWFRARGWIGGMPKGRSATTAELRRRT